MSAGYAPDPEEDPPIPMPPGAQAAAPGLAGFDADAAAQTLAAIGQPTPTPAPQVQLPSAEPVTAMPAPPVPAAPPPDAATQPPETAQPAAGGGETAAAAPPGALPPPPAPPAPTGDPTKDVAANVAYGRALTDWHAAATRARAEADKQVASLEATRAGRELAAEQHAEERRKAEAAEYKRIRDNRQAAIDSSVAERQAAKEQAGKSWWETSTVGQKVGAALLYLVGDWQAGMRNAAAAQLGQVGQAQNEGLKTIFRLMDSDAARKKERYAAASDSLLEARYGFKDAADNHRAAQNDIDADTAANYRLAAKQFEADLRKRGATDADLKANETLAALYDKANQNETQIHQREEEMASHRQQAEAQNKLAEAHLEQGERQIKATEQNRADTLADRTQGRKDTLAERRFEHAMALADRADARAARKDEKKEKADAAKASDEEKRTLRDPETGEPLIVLGNARAVQAASDKLTASRAYSNSLRQLADHIERYERVGSDLPIVGTDEGRERSRLGNEAIARGRKALELGVSQGNLALEHGAVGGLGIGLDPHQMASPKGLRAMADEQDKIAIERLRSSGKAAPGADIARSVGGEKAATPARPATMTLGKITYHLQPDGTYK